MVGSLNGNDGLTWVAECRPDASLANGEWMWIDAGFAAPISYPYELGKLGGMCPAGFAMTGAYFNVAGMPTIWKVLCLLRIGCDQDAEWHQAFEPEDIAPRCPLNSRDGDGKPRRDGLVLRLKCTRYGSDIDECGPRAGRNEAPCDVNAQCIVSEYTGTRCVCNEGYTGSGRHGSCNRMSFLLFGFPSNCLFLAIDPCKENENSCAPAPGGKCTTTGPGTFQCSCNPGYTLFNITQCKATLNPTSTTTTVYPNFAATCVFGGREGSDLQFEKSSISFYVQKGDRNPLGTMIKVRIDPSAPLDQVYRWDIREFSVDTGSNAEACWSSGAPWVAGGGPGFTLKYGTTNLSFFLTNVI